MILPFNVQDLRGLRLKMRGTSSILALAFLMSACGVRNTQSSTSLLTTDCVLSPDQGGTLTGRWVQPAVPIAFHAGDWNSSEMSAITAAADKWNSFFAASMGYPAIDYGSAASPRTSNVPHTTDEQDFCANQTIVNTDSTFNAPIVIYKQGTWDQNISAVIALTTTCHHAVTGKILPRFHDGFMDINYVNFFVNGNRVPDLQSIVLHEMGHLMGINHSCESAPNGAGVPTCSGMMSSSYRTASMYPTFSFFSSGAGEVRRSLNDNDAGRMNCVYKYL